MNPETIEQQLESLNIRPDEISTEESSKAINLLLQLIEGLHIENEKLKIVLNLRTVVELVERGIIPRTVDKAQLIVDLIKEY
ncbi:MAG: hypothetical protein MIO93_04595 [ANME-2 cluster archaeon]|nr:hypothetical protein [ANME-2 cluster archaeon]